MKALSRLTALIVEPRSGMRASLHNMLTQCEITKIDHAVSAGTAIRSLQARTYDIILCEYDLGDGQDGQQLLEDLRHHKLIPLSTIFIMVTAERTQAKVVSAAELAPTDYLLKPFTADALLERIGRAVERRTALMPVYQLMEHGDLNEAIAACVEGERSTPKFLVDFMRRRAELHMTLGQASEAEAIYIKLHDARAVAWARLGLAKTLFMQNRYQDAEEMLTGLVAESPQFLDAYDWLAKAHEAIGQLPAAASVLKDAVAVSPHAVRRLRKLGQMALDTGDIDTAEASFQKVVSKARYSEFRDPEDHVRLVKTLVRKGDAQQAAAVVRDLEKSLGSQPKTAACRAISSALIHESNGDAARAAEEFMAAVAACRENVGLSNDMKMSLATSCLENELKDGATEMMRDVMNNSGDDAGMAKVMSVFERAGHKDLAERVAKQSRRHVVELVSSGADKARQGDFRGAVELMTSAAHKLPENPQVIFNAAVAALKCLEQLGWDGTLGGQARWYVENARRLDPRNPRLVPLTDLYQQILTKYGILPSQVMAKPPLGA
jgi:DNA-binding response OmpR family regulator